VIVDQRVPLTTITHSQTSFYYRHSHRLPLQLSPQRLAWRLWCVHTTNKSGDFCRCVETAWTCIPLERTSPHHDRPEQWLRSRTDTKYIEAECLVSGPGMRLQSLIFFVPGQRRRRCPHSPLPRSQALPARIALPPSLLSPRVWQESPGAAVRPSHRPVSSILRSVLSGYRFCGSSLSWHVPRGGVLPKLSWRLAQQRAHHRLLRPHQGLSETPGRHMTECIARVPLFTCVDMTPTSVSKAADTLQNEGHGQVSISEFAAGHQSIDVHLISLTSSSNRRAVANGTELELERRRHLYK